ncbi:MAG: LamG-like jellyroll fold domain-containing protein [Planctomycetota bacterium]
MRRTCVLSVSIVLLTITVCARAQDPDLLAWWKFDEGTGTIAFDSSGNGNDGTFVQDPEWVAGKFGSGLLFDGQGGERVSLGGLDIPSGAMTVTCWFKANNLDTPGQDPRMVSKANGGGNNDHWWMFSSSRIGSEKFLRLRLKTNDGQATSEIKAGTFEVGEWIHGAIWWDGTDMKIYKNGVEVGTLAKGGTSVALDPAVQAAIGNQPIGAENRPFDGIIDDVRIYTRALTEAELQEVMAGPPAPLAAGPDPADGAILEQNWANLSWQPGTWAVSHDVYFGTSFEDVDQGAEGAFVGNTTSTFLVVGFPGFPAPEGLQPGTTYYWRVDEVNPDNPDSPWKGVVWSFTLPPRGAYRPIPADGMKFVQTNAQLSWTAKWGAALFSVYFGTDPIEVDNATGAVPSGKKTFDPGPLELDTTHYWRVDSFDGTTWTTGNVWSFTTTRPGGGLVGEYANYGGGVPDPPESPFQNVTLTRIDPGVDFQWGNGSPEPGVINDDNFAVRWTGELEIPLTGRYTFKTTTDDGVLLYINGVEMAKAWRTQAAVEQGSTIDLVAGEFASIKMLYFATTGNAQADLRWSHDLFPEEIIPAAALSPPLRAGLISPTNQAVNVTQAPVLLWTAGDHAAEHDVYFGMDAAAVAAADTATADIYQGRQAETSFSPAKLQWDTTYYWRVDEVNDLHQDSPWKGSVWSFTTADFLIIDDFEGYDAYESQIWWAWKDGLGYAAHDNEPAYSGNGTGSAVGDETTVSYTEETIRHSGSQSMPLFYDNNKQGLAKYSEAELTLSANRNWTEDGVQELSLWFHGDPANAPERLYVAISNPGAPGSAAVVYHDNPNATQTDIWQEWVIPLQAFADQGINLTNVDRIAIGLGSRGNQTAPGGSGKMLFDDIRLYRPTAAP